MKHAIDVGPFNELADPRVMARLAARAEERGWDGFFVWDHIMYSPPVGITSCTARRCGRWQTRG
jgi:alkanesulfonate monooxygenase SsuD/methylene tetrahydromethanopterin reductase-like flavin-dependent oxidoreductase (luciferase family)